MKDFKDFKVGFFFTMESGRNVTKNLMVNEGLPVIQGGETNRGVLGYVSEDFALVHKLNIIEDPLFLTVARVGSSGYVALHDKKSVIGDNAKVLRCKIPLGLNVMLYLQTCLNKFGIFYDYSNVVSEKNYLNHIISLPVTPEGSPDYDYMEYYIKGIQWQYIGNLLETNEAERDRLLSIVGLSLDEYESVKGNIELSEATSYGEFKVGDLFEIKNCKAYHKDSLVITENPKGINYVTRTTYNNAIECKVELNENLSVNKGNSIIFGAESARFFYQNDDYITGNKVYKIHADNFNKNLCLYLVSCLNKTIETMGFGYSNGLVPSRANEIIIQLPTTQTGEVDYQYMEDYISKIKLIYIYIIESYLLTNK